MEDKIRELILSSIPGLREQERNKTLRLPCFFLDYGYLENGSVFGNGKCEISDQYVQIDLYYLDEKQFKDAKKKIKKEIGKFFTFPEIESYYDTTNKFYRAIIKIIVQESEE